MGSMSATTRILAVPVRQDRVGDAPVGPDGRVVPGHAQLVGRVVVAVDQVGDRHVGDRGESVGHTGRDVDTEVLVRPPVHLAQVQHLGGAIGAAPLTQVVQDHSGMAERHVPVVGLVQVVVEAHDAVRHPVPAVGLDHLPAPGEPLTPVRLDEVAAVVAEQCRGDDVDTVDELGWGDLRHGTRSWSGPELTRRGALVLTRGRWSSGRRSSIGWPPDGARSAGPPCHGRSVSRSGGAPPG